MGAQADAQVLPHVVPHDTATAAAAGAPRFAFKPLHHSAAHDAHTHSPHDSHNHSHDHSHGHSHGHSHDRSHDHAHGAAVMLSSSQQQQQPPPATAELSPLDELFYCAKTNNLARFRELIHEQTQAPPRDGQPPLGEHSPSRAAAELVQQRDAQGHTLPHWIAQAGSAEFLEYVASLGAPLDLPSDDSVQLHPIHWACSKGNLAALKTLVKLGVDVNTADAAKRRTPLLIAAQNGFPLLVMYCVKHGADVNLLDVDDDSAIHWAAYKGATEIVSVFQYLGVSTDKQDRYGQTPLHLAAMRGQFETVQYLVEELESDLGVRDAHGRTPLELAKAKGFHHVAAYLARRQFRAKWNVLAWWESSRTPYYFVLANIPITIVIYLRFMIPYMPEMRALYVVHLLWNAVMWSLFFLTKRTSPGDLARVSTHQDEYTAVTEELVQESTTAPIAASHRCLLERPLCHSCHIQRPLRAKHCRVCKVCVDTFDHHCPFVDNCVGRGNYVYFMGFVGALTLDLAALEYVLYLQWRAHGPVWWLVLFMIYGVVLLVPVGNLFGFHLYLTAKNLTTNEVVNSHRYQYLRGTDGAYRNPFDRGFVANFADRCLPTHLADGHDRQHGAPFKGGRRNTTDDDERRRFLSDASDASRERTKQGEYAGNNVAALPV